jgi:SAM-dependent methyltransferase
MRGSAHPADVERFWQANPVAASSIDALPGSPEFFRAFDVLRESDQFEPYECSDHIHGYSRSRGLRVLDIGCGNGYVLSRYARQGAEVHGVDLTSTAVELSRKRFELEGMAGSFTVNDGTGLPYPDGYFDIVCSMGVLHHIPDPGPVVEEMHRVLRPGGRIIVMLYYRYSWKNLVILRLFRLFSPRYRGKSQQEALNMNDGDACPLARVYDRRSATDLLRPFVRHLFEIDQLPWDHLLLFRRPLVSLAARFFPASNRSWLARHLGWNLYVTAFKPNTETIET